MAPATPCIAQPPACPPTLFLAVEVGENKWPLGCTPGAAQRPRARPVAAGDFPTVGEEICRAKQRFGLPDNARGISCDEAGREGLGRHRFFVRHGIENAVGDSASMEGHRRYRRAKTARLDGHHLLTRRLRYAAGARKVWRVVRGPSGDDADRRHLPRELRTAKRDRTRVSHRMPGGLAGYGGRMALHGDVEAPLAQGHQAAGSPVPAAWRARLKRAWQHVCCLPAQITGLAGARRGALRTRQAPVMEKVRHVSTGRGIGGHRAWRFVMECFAGRALQTPQPVGAFAGLTPPPSPRGESRRERGIPQAGQGSRRTLAGEMAWGWGRLQPERTLTQWSQTRGGQGRGRLRQIGSGALARKLLSALWRLLKTGEIAPGAVLTAAMSGESIPEGEQVLRGAPRVLGWGGQLVAGPGCAGRTD